MEEFGPYRIVRRIAVGGMAEIFLARQHSFEGLERTVIIKRILPRYNEDEEFITMFLDEARLMAALSHPNIAQVFDLGILDSSYYLVMEYVHGPTLGSLMHASTKEGNTSLPLKEALALVMGIAEALAYVHGRRDELGRLLNIVHRDLNPANVMVSYDGAVKLIDFGIAKTARRVYETRTGVIKGTYGYIAPEQFTHAAPVDHRADIFALGVIIYEMCVGKHPFDVEDERQLMERIFSARYKRPREVNRGISPALERIITECLAPHPEGRPDNVRALISRLAAYLCAEGFVPTMGDIANLAQRLTPDQEGPEPLHPKVISSVLQQPRKEPTSTHSISRQGDRIEVRPITGERDSEGPTINGGLQRRAPKTMEVDPEEDSDIITRVEANPLTREPSAKQDTLQVRSSIKQPWPKVRVREDSSSTQRRNVKRWTLQLSGLAIFLVLSGWLTWWTLESEPEQERPPRPKPIVSTTSVNTAPRTLRIFSEPQGASIWVDGQLLAQRTPTEYTLGKDSRSAWIRVGIQGYAPMEREVFAMAGEARFVLTPLGKKK